MDMGEKRRPQTSGHEGVVCHKCGWVYPNAHPSAKQRRAHRKNCGTVDGAAVSTDAGGDGKKASDDELSDEDLRKSSVELVVEDLKLAIEEGKEVKGCVGSEGEVGNLGEDAILETNNADNTLEPHVLLYSSQVHGPGIQCSASQLESDKHFENHAWSCNADVSSSVNMDAATKHTGSSDSSVLTKAFVVASEERQGFASAQSKVNNTMIVNDINVGTYAKNDMNGNIPVSPTLIGNHAIDFSTVDSQLQKMDDCLEINAPLDHATVSTLTKVFPDQVSASITEPNSDPCHAQDEQTDGSGQLSQNELLSNAGSCLLENNDGEYLDASIHFDQFEYQIGKPDEWKVNGNEMENINALQMPLSTPLGENFQMKPGYCEDDGSVEPNVTVISAGSEAGNELNYHLEVEAPKIVPVVELDKVANGIPSTIPFHENNPTYEDTVGINAINELNDDQSHKDKCINGDRSTLLDFEHEAGLSPAMSEGFEVLGSDGLETHSCIAIAGTSGVEEIILDDQVTGSQETCVAIQLEEFEIEFQCEMDDCGDHASDLSTVDSQLQKMDDCVEINAPLDHATVSTLMKVFPDQVSASIKEPNSDPCHAQDEQTDGGGQLSQSELLSNAGSCLMENSDGEYLDASIHFDQIEYQNGKPDEWKVNGNEMQNINALQMPSSTPLGENFQVKPGYFEDYGSVEPNVTVISAGSEAGNEQNYHMEVDAPKIVPVVKLDKVANGIPSTIPFHENNQTYEDTVGINAIDELNDDQSRKDEHINGDRSTPLNDFEHEAGLSPAMPEGFEVLGSDGLETHSCIAITRTSGVEEIILDDQVTGSQETCAASIQLEEFETEFQCEEHFYSSAELLLQDNMVAAEVSGVAASDFSQGNVTTNISNEIQLVIDEATEVSNHCVTEELKQEIREEESCHSTKTYPQPKYDSRESEPQMDEYIGANELEKDKDLSASILLDHVLGLEHDEKNSRHLENKTEDHSDELEQKFLNFTENIVGDDTDDPHMRMKLQNEHINIANSLLEELRDEVDDHKVQTENTENVSGSPLGPQNGFQDDSMDTSVRDDCKCSIPEIGVQISCIQSENGLAKVSSEEPDSKEGSVHLFTYSAQDFTLEWPVTSTSVESSTKNPITCNNSEIDGTSGVASGVCYQSLQEEHVHVEPKQQPNVSADANGQTDGVEELQGSATDETVPSIRHKTGDIPILDPRTLLPTTTQTPKDLCTSTAEEGGLPESGDIDIVIFKEPSFMTQVEPGRRSVSHEIQSIQNSQVESEAGKKNKEITAKAVRGNSGRVHVPLKTLLAEATFENPKVTNAQEHDKPLEDNKRQALQDEGCTAKAWSSKIASEGTAESSLSQADYREWNSPARLPVNKNQKRRVKGKQPWVPFICCQSIY